MILQRREHFRVRGFPVPSADLYGIRPSDRFSYYGKEVLLPNTDMSDLLKGKRTSGFVTKIRRNFVMQEFIFCTRVERRWTQELEHIHRIGHATQVAVLSHNNRIVNESNGEVYLESPSYLRTSQSSGCVGNVGICTGKQRKKRSLASLILTTIVFQTVVVVVVRGNPWIIHQMLLTWQWKFRR